MKKWHRQFLRDQELLVSCVFAMPENNLVPTLKQLSSLTTEKYNLDLAVFFLT